MAWKPSLRHVPPADNLYIRLAEELIAAISSGELKPGTRLPPQRELADFLDIPHTTVTRAYNFARERGYIYGSVGKGTFVAAPFAQPPDRAPIDLRVVDPFPSLGTDEILSAARRVLDCKYASHLFTYAMRDGTDRQRAAACQWAARLGVMAQPSETAIFPGTQSILSAALLGVIGSGESVACDPFTYSNFVQLARLAKVRLVPVRGDACGMLPDALDTAVKRHSVKGVFLMPLCANPTGVTMPEQRKAELARVVRARNIVVIEDAATLVPPEGKFSTMFARCPDRTIHIAASMRLVAPGMRISFAVARGDLFRNLVRSLHLSAIKASALEAEIAAELVTSGYADAILRLKAIHAAERNRVFDSLLGVESSSCDFDNRLFRTLPLSPRTASMPGPGIEELIEHEAGVRVCHAWRFAAAGQSGGFIRVSIATQTPEVLSLALSRMLPIL
ncbi:MAG: PLP-dependent aminotransferase family protein [Kiritimatiellae bacterium]|nr:PLP-dependent aminotransferase family protein [Kiritimatiellia bacterium]